MKKFHHFTKNNVDIAIIWETKKIKTLFRLKDEELYPACKILLAKYNKKWPEHDNPNKGSETARHLHKHIIHVFTW